MEAQQVALAIVASASTGEGAASVDLSLYFNITIQVAGVTGDVLNLEASVDGTNYTAVKSTLANGIFTLAAAIGASPCVKYLRVNKVSGSDAAPKVTYLAQSLGY
jgi:hypothetical protein